MFAKICKKNVKNATKALVSGENQVLMWFLQVKINTTPPCIWPSFGRPGPLPSGQFGDNIWGPLPPPTWPPGAWPPQSVTRKTPGNKAFHEMSTISLVGNRGSCQLGGQMGGSRYVPVEPKGKTQNTQKKVKKWPKILTSQLSKKTTWNWENKVRPAWSTPSLNDPPPKWSSRVRPEHEQHFS